jgi:phosphoglucomutase
MPGSAAAIRSNVAMPVDLARTEPFTEAHILAITQAVCDYRQSRGVDGPLYLGSDGHAVSGPAQCLALEVLAGNGVETVIQQNGGATPAAVISRAILAYNRGRKDHFADGLAIGSSGGQAEEVSFQYDASDGGPAGTHANKWIQNRADDLLRNGNKGVQRMVDGDALRAGSVHKEDLVLPYVHDLRCVVDMDAIRAARLDLVVNGGPFASYWEAIDSFYGLNLTVTEKSHSDRDAELGGLNAKCPLAVALHYLLDSRQRWEEKAAIGKTVIGSGMIDRVARKFDRGVYEVPPGFKWFKPRLFNGSCCFAGAEGSGATFLRRDGTVWTTDRDGLIMDLLAAEITAWTGKEPAEHYSELTAELGPQYYTQLDVTTTPQQKAELAQLSPEAIRETHLAGEPITAKLTRAPGNHAPIGGLKLVTAGGWVAALAGAENLFKFYAESFMDQIHLNAIVGEAREIVDRAVRQP